MDTDLQTINQEVSFEVEDKTFENAESHSENIDYSKCFETVDSNITTEIYDNKNDLENGNSDLQNSYNLNLNQDRGLLNINEPVKLKEEMLENVDSKFQDIANFNVNLRMDTELGNIKQEVMVKKERLENNDYIFIFENTNSYLQDEDSEHNGKLVGKMEIKEEIKDHVEQNFKTYPDHDLYVEDTKSDLTMKTDHAGFGFENSYSDANITYSNNKFSGFKSENVPTTFDIHVSDRKFENSASSDKHRAGHRTDIPFKDSTVLTKYDEHKIDNVRDKGVDTVSISNIARNIVVHSPDAAHQCKRCDRYFRTAYELRRHTPCIEYPYKCNMCNRALKTLGGLRKHMSKHSDKQLHVHQCSKCEKQFIKSSLLKSHMVHHTTERPHQCNVCDKGFKTVFELESHMTSHSTERPHKCNVCEKGFKTVGNLGSHMTIHSTERPHRCNVCDKGFKTVSDLGSHMTSHSTERPHKCSLCDKGFKTKKSVRLHMVHHSTERPQYVMCVRKDLSQRTTSDCI